MCNDYERHIEWAAYEAALAEAGLGTTSDTSAGDLPGAHDVRVGDMAPGGYRGRQLGRACPDALEVHAPAPRRPTGLQLPLRGARFHEEQPLPHPASAFFEFTDKTPPKTKWRFELSGSPVFAVAGLWREDDKGRAFTMLTTAPGPDIARYHGRQIAVLHSRRWGDWLFLHEANPALLAPLPAGALSVTMARQGRDLIAPELLEAAG